MRVGRPVTERRDGEHVVTADVNGEPVWFRSSEIAPAGSAEAFGSALLIPALHAGMPLHLPGRADRRWRANSARAAALVAGWWGYEPARVQVKARRRPSRRRAAVALCFTGGVDSFHSLRRLRPDLLLYVTGYDVSLHDDDRARRVEQLVRDVARESGAAALVLRSNLREHSAVAAVSWERSHGGALAAAGHLIHRAAGTLAISSGLHRSSAQPWGTHWRLDPLWSASRLDVRHVGDDVWHIAKTRELAGDPLARRHLRVCWEHRTEALNCSHCDKCLITMAVLADEGALGHFHGFDDADAIPERLAALPHTRYLNSWGRLLETGLGDERVQEEATRLVERTWATVGRTHA
jgi:hypothetical protein